jgi:hypothetical protein
MSFVYRRSPSQLNNDTRALPDLDVQSAEQSICLVDCFLIRSKINYERIDLLMVAR